MSKHKKVLGKLGQIIMWAALLLLIGLWALLSTDLSRATWIDLVKNVVAGLLAPLITFIFLYYTFFRKGIDIEAIIKDQDTSWLKQGFEKYDDIDWRPFIENAEKIVIVSFFYEEWMKKYATSFEVFFKKRNPRLVVYLPNYKNAPLMANLNQLIPEHSSDALVTKIKDSIKCIKETCGTETQVVTINLYNNLFNYTTQLFDDTMFLSINQLKRDRAYQSPFITFDLTRSEALDAFFKREINTLEENSEKIDIRKWHS